MQQKRIFVTLLFIVICVFLYKSWPQSMTRELKVESMKTINAQGGYNPKHRYIKLALPFTKQALGCLQYMSFENTVAKREIARDEQFRLFPQCFLLC